MGSKKIILFCHTGLSTFVQTDLDLLLEEYEVIPYHYKLGKSKMMKFVNIISSFFFALKWVRKVDVVYVWFGGYHGFFPVLMAKMLKKKTVITVGGYDAVNIPSIKFGVFYQNDFLTWCIKKQYQWANYILPVDESLEKSINYYADPSGFGYLNGIRNFVETKAKITTVPFGYDDMKFQRNIKVVKKNAVISVGCATTEQVFRRKGFDLVIDVAIEMPEIPFTLIGISKKLQNVYEKRIPSNVTIYDFLDHGAIIDLLSAHRVFLQLSLSEGLPNTLCEAMLCECIPIGSDVNGIPKAIGDTGYILKEKKVEILKELIKEALSLDDNFGIKARERISKMFPLKRRIASLKAIIEN